mgnify:CR=1 FL=1
MARPELRHATPFRDGGWETDRDLVADFTRIVTPDGQPLATMEDDANGDGWVDLRDDDGLAGEMKNVGLRSPKPNTAGTPGAGDPWVMIGMMVRVIRFQSSVSLKGMTGWTFSTQRVALLGPMPKSKLF